MCERECGCVCVYVWVNVCVYECVSTLLRKSSSVSENNSGVVQYRQPSPSSACVCTQSQLKTTSQSAVIEVCWCRCVCKAVCARACG